MDQDQRQPLLKAPIDDHDIHNRKSSGQYDNYSSIATIDHVDDSAAYDVVRSSQVAGNGNIQTENGSKVKGRPDFKLYKRRWYILVLYSVFAGTQGGVWNTWGPIAASSEEAFGWVNADISLLINWGPIAFVVSAVFFSWMMQVKGLRLASLFSMLLIACGCGVRCITSNPPAVKWLMNLGQLLTGLGGPTAMAGPPVLSAVWFGPHERATSTALAFSITNFIFAASYFLGPLLVPDKTTPNCSMPNHTDFYSSGYPVYRFQMEGIDLFNNNSCSNASKASRIKEERKDIMFLMYIEFGWSLAVLLAMLIYFPKKPPLPPCITASMQRKSFLAGLLKLLCNGWFWMLCAAYGMATGVLNCWLGALDVVLKPHGIDEKEVGWIGFYATCAGCVGALVTARFADIFSKHMKWIILMCYAISLGFFIWFALMLYGIAPTTTVFLYLTVIAGSTFINSAVPLLFELGCEITYPVAEGTANGILTLINNISGLVFLVILMIPNIGSSWMNWMLVGAIAICVPILLLLKDTYTRLELDETQAKKSEVSA